MHTGAEFPITSEAFFVDPYATMRRMREECPVYFHAPLQIWCLTRYDHCDSVVRDPRFSSRRAGELLGTLLPTLRGTPELDAMVAQWSRLLWFLDPPRHTRSRTMINRGLSPTALERHRPGVRAIVRRALSLVAAGEEVELVRDFADPIAIGVLSRMFGIPDADHADFCRWVTDAIQIAGAGAMSEEASNRCKESSANLFAYLAALVAERRARPGADMVSHFLEGEPDDPDVNQEIAIQCVQTIGAGYVTPRNQMGNTILSLLRFPDELTRLRRDRSLLKPAIEELLRFDLAVLSTSRIAAEDVEIGGALIQRGTLVFPMLAAANRDPEVFPDPDRLDFGRQNVKSMAFSFGRHYCPGGALARMQLEEVLTALLEFDSWELAGPFEYRGSSLQDRGPSRLPVRLSRAVSG